MSKLYKEQQSQAGLLEGYDEDEDLTNTNNLMNDEMLVSSNGFH